jgi:hypothetical protein
MNQPQFPDEGTMALMLMTVEQDRMIMSTKKAMQLASNEVANESGNW